MKGNTMDESFEHFLSKGFAPAIESSTVSEDTLTRFRHLLPQWLLDRWSEYGFAGFGDGRFWMVNPDEWAPALDAWLEDTELASRDRFFVLGRTAFGALDCWGETTARSLRIEPHFGLVRFDDTSAKYLARGRSDVPASTIFATQDFERCDFDDASNKPLFARALKKLGRLSHDEMYAFEPALALGGPAKIERTVKLKAVEHLVFLAQVGEKKVSMSNPYVEFAKRQGLL
jgi:hypothetical protein